MFGNAARDRRIGDQQEAIDYLIGAHSALAAKVSNATANAKDQHDSHRMRLDALEADRDPARDEEAAVYALSVEERVCRLEANLRAVCDALDNAFNGLSSLALGFTVPDLPEAQARPSDGD